MAVFDLAGRARAMLFQGEMPAGTHRLVWNGRDAEGRELPSGAYTVRARTGRQGASTARVIWIR